MLEINALSKTFGTTRAVNAATFEVGEGELICLLGPSGCGKSTLLRMIAGLVDHDSGQLRINDRDISNLPANKRPSAMVFQSHALWNHMNVAGNVGFGLRVRRLPRDVIHRKVSEALAIVGLAGYERRRPTELSGGQAQRVALARCLVVEPKVLLMDEPFSALDAHLRKNLRDELRALQRRLGLATIFVTHDQEEAMELADRIVVLSEGRIEQIGAPSDLYLAPASLTVARFIGTMNEVNSTVLASKADFCGATVSVAVPNGQVTLLCRPEDMIASPNGAVGRVTRIVDLGPMLRLTLSTGGGTDLVWLCPRSAAPRVDDVIRLAPTRLHVYRDGKRIEPDAPLLTPRATSLVGVA